MLTFKASLFDVSAKQLSDLVGMIHISWSCSTNLSVDYTPTVSSLSLVFLSKQNLGRFLFFFVKKDYIPKKLLILQYALPNKVIFELLPSLAQDIEMSKEVTMLSPL